MIDNLIKLSKVIMRDKLKKLIKSFQDQYLLIYFGDYGYRIRRLIFVMRNSKAFSFTYIIYQLFVFCLM